MNDLPGQLDLLSLALGVLLGLLFAVPLAAALLQRAGRAARALAESERERQSATLAEAVGARATAERDLAVAQTRMAEQQANFRQQIESLEQAEKRLLEAFERLSGKVFDERSQQFTQLSEQQLKLLLQPLGKDLESFRKRVDETHGEELKQHAALRERLLQLEGLNASLNQEARNLTRALTSDSKAQGNWGEQQLERLLELSGLNRGEGYYVQHSVTGPNGERLQPDFVLTLPEGRSIVLDSKVSLTAWTRCQSATDEDEARGHLADHVRSIKAHIDSLSAKNYPGVESLKALDFVLLFVPVEAALIAALRQDPDLPQYAISKRVALLSPTNFLATLRTVASVWAIYKQNTNARDIADRAGRIYDKFAGFMESLTEVGQRLGQAQQSYDKAWSQLSTGSGNLVRQFENLSKLGARHQKQLDAALVEQAGVEQVELEAGQAPEAEPKLAD